MILEAQPFPYPCSCVPFTLPAALAFIDLDKALYADADGFILRYYSFTCLPEAVHHKPCGCRHKNYDKDRQYKLPDKPVEIGIYKEYTDSKNCYLEKYKT